MSTAGSTSTDDRPARLIEGLLDDFVADPLRNTLGPGTADPSWAESLVGFSRGDDPLWQDLKVHAGSQHWTPAEAFALGAAATDAARLTVVSWVLVQTEATKAANRRESLMPSEPWARARIFGQEGNRALHQTIIDGLAAEGYVAVAPALLPQWTDNVPRPDRWASNWSERHVAYVSGLGTFGLSGGLITEKGKAVRFGSVVVEALIPATRRHYSGPFDYCLHFAGQDCAVCADRCPTGSVDVAGRDKEACAAHLRRSEEYVKREYAFAGYGCGLCQTGVPCESGIPEALRHRTRDSAAD